MVLDKNTRAVSIYQMEINKKNELVIDEKLYIVKDNNYDEKDLVFEKGQWV